MTTADDFTIAFDVTRDLNDGGDINWRRLDDAYDDDIDATLSDGTVIPVDKVDEAKSALENLVLARLLAAAEAHGWTAADYNPMEHDTEARTLHQMDEDGDIIAEELQTRYAALWAEIDDPTGAEILAEVQP